MRYIVNNIDRNRIGDSDLEVFAILDPAKDNVLIGYMENWPKYDGKGVINHRDVRLEFCTAMPEDILAEIIEEVVDPEGYYIERRGQDYLVLKVDIEGRDPFVKTWGNVPPTHVWIKKSS